MPTPVRAALLAAVLATCATAASASAAAPPEIHAHRGGTVVEGKARFAEETLAAYAHAARDGFVLEVDAKLTRDGVPVAIHDATLGRTTSCSGEVRSFTRAALRACRPDVLGSPGGGVPTRQVSPRGFIPTIAEVLELARLTGAKVNLEIKNVPTDPDFDTTSAYADRVMDVVVAAGLPRSQLLIQSFIPANLDVAKRRLPRVATSVLALAATPEGIELARTAGYRWISPRWPFAPAFVRDAHRLGRLVAPYTLNERAQVRAAGRAGVDAVITDDPLMAARALGVRPVRALRVRLRRRAGRVEVEGRLVPPRGVSARRGCSGVVTLRVVGANRTLHANRTRLARDCLVKVAVPVPRGAPARLLATVGFGGNSRLLPRLNGPRPVPREVPRAVPHTD
jgi:glycerophosphoryl diester phosphodiesterase